MKLCVQFRSGQQVKMRMGYSTETQRTKWSATRIWFVILYPVFTSLLLHIWHVLKSELCLTVLNLKIWFIWDWLWFQAPTIVCKIVVIYRLNVARKHCLPPIHYYSEMVAVTPESGCGKSNAKICHQEFWINISHIFQFGFCSFVIRLDQEFPVTHHFWHCSPVLLRFVESLMMRQCVI